MNHKPDAEAHVKAGDKRSWLWNELPEGIRWIETLTIFKKDFKTLPSDKVFPSKLECHSQHQALALLK